MPEREHIATIEVYRIKPAADASARPLYGALAVDATGERICTEHAEWLTVTGVCTRIGERLAGDVKSRDSRAEVP